jgi:hypothetical protein
VDGSFPDSGQDALSKVTGPLYQPIHHSSLDVGAHGKSPAKIYQVCEYEERGEVQSPVNICLAHSARLCTQPHPPVADAGPVRVDDGEPVTYFSWACPNADWSCWNTFHNFYLQKGMWSSRAGTISE